MSTATNQTSLSSPSANSRACKTCALAKAKCVPRSGGINKKCERCHRLKKECASQAPSTRVRKRQKTTRVAQLESKLDGIVSLLQQQNGSTSQAVSPQNSAVRMSKDSEQAVIPRSPPPSLSGQDFSSLTTDNQKSSQVSTPKDLAPPSLLPRHDFGAGTNGTGTGTKQRQSVYATNTNACLTAYSNADLEPSDEEIERLLKLYQTELTRNFPFVVIELKGMTGKEWLAEKPLLGKAVLMAASYYHLPRQTLYDVQIVRELTERAIIKGEKTLELLQTILVFCGWYHYHCIGHPQLNNYLGIAIGLIGDLGLNKPPVLDSFRYPFGMSRATQGDFTTRSMEQRRALAGAYYLTAMVSSAFSRIEAMRYPLHLAECIQIISEKKEYPTDILLVELIKIVHVEERIVQSIYASQLEREIRVPTALTLGAFKAELVALKSGIPGEWRDNLILQVHHHVTTIHLYEISLTPSWTNSPTSTSSTLSHTHHTALYTCLQHTHSFLSLILSIPPSIYLSLPIAPWGLTSYGLMILARLSFFTHPSLPAWNMAFVRGECDMSFVLGELASRNERAKFRGVEDASVLNSAAAGEGMGLGLRGQGIGGGEGMGGMGKGVKERERERENLEGLMCCFDKFAAKIRLVKVWWDGMVTAAEEKEKEKEKEKRPQTKDGELHNAGLTPSSLPGGVGITAHDTYHQTTNFLNEYLPGNSGNEFGHDTGMGFNDIDMNMWQGLNGQNCWDWVGDWGIGVEDGGVGF